MRIILLIALAGLMQAAGSFAPSPGTGSGAAGTALAFGYLLLSAFFAGDLCESIKLPRLTGYILAGIAAGPSVLNLVTTRDDRQSPDLQRHRDRADCLDCGRRTRLAGDASAFQVDSLADPAGRARHRRDPGSLTAYFGRAWIPFMQGMSHSQAIAAALVLGVTMVAQSPAVVVALRAEMAADGPLTRTVLGVVVVSDLVVVLLFAAGFLDRQDAFRRGGRCDPNRAEPHLGTARLHVIGVLVGGIVFLYLRYIRAAGSLFVVVVGFIVAEVGQRVDLDPLIVALAAGLFIRNATTLGQQLLEAVEGAALPVYVVFFAVTGASLRLADLWVMGPAALLFAGVRAGGFAAGSWSAARVAGAPAWCASIAAFGLVPQAGLALALALLLAQNVSQLRNRRLVVDCRHGDDQPDRRAGAVPHGPGEERRKRQFEASLTTAN